MPLWKDKEVPYCKCPSRGDGKYAKACCDCGGKLAGGGFSIRLEGEIHSLCRDCVSKAEHDDEEENDD